MINRHVMLITVAVITVTLTGSTLDAWGKRMTDEEVLKTVIEQVPPLQHSLGDRIPLRGSRLEGWLPDDDAEALEFLRALADRGIGLSPRWNPSKVEASIARSLRMARLQTQLGLPVSVNANRCIYSFFNGDEDTLHVADDGSTFYDDSFSSRKKMGCPFRLEQRKEAIKAQFVPFLEAYKQAGLNIDFIYVDWEIDGPVEWNGAWEHSKRCRVCRENIPDIDDFRSFQRALRKIRSALQRECYSDLVKSYFPHALVGNYSVNPHNGWRYWYDYYEYLPEGAPFRTDQQEKYRPWYHEFDECGYTFANPVCYTWYATWSWYPAWDNDDYRWFYNLLKVGTNACRNTPRDVPVIPWVHWHTTAPPADAPPVPQMSEWAYKEFLWHLFLRGADGLMMWCRAEETVKEVSLMNEVLDETLAWREFLDEGEPVIFTIPRRPASVVSGLRLGDRVLVRRTDFGDYHGPVTRCVGGVDIVIPACPGRCQIVTIEQ
ncbi:MAG: hypothetical protein J7M38_06805 [Armatimonadetes bacterium]|nr:hypothetical protein [Armatimonadota bacterium]